MDYVLKALLAKWPLMQENIGKIDTN